ncbi:MAG: flagellin [Thalassovita sp.]
MKLVSMGDMAQTWALRRQNVSLNSEMLRLTQELSSGETTNIAQHLNGDLRYLSDVEHRGRTAQAYETAVSAAGGFAGAMQAALETIQTGTETLGADLLIGAGGTQGTRQALAHSAEQKLHTIVSALNTSYAGRSLFAGDATGSAALAPAQEILSELRNVVAGEVTSDGIEAAVRDWFAAPDGFAAMGYLGSTENLSPFRLGERDMIHLDLRADAPELRDLMADVALAALSADYSTADVQTGLLKRAGNGLLQDQDNLTALRADLGFAESRIEEIGAGIAAERVSLNYAREALLGVDEYEAATRLENVQFQLEALYTVTARLSGLSLVDYL